MPSSIAVQISLPSLAHSSARPRGFLRTSRCVKFVCSSLSLSCTCSVCLSGNHNGSGLTANINSKIITSDSNTCTTHTQTFTQTWGTRVLGKRISPTLLRSLAHALLFHEWIVKWMVASFAAFFFLIYFKEKKGFFCACICLDFCSGLDIVWQRSFVNRSVSVI